MTAMIAHTGGCHCGRVRFEVMAPAIIQVSDCNCSICAKSGYLHLMVPKSRSHPDGFSVNARCLDEGTVQAMRVQAFDGRHWEQQYPQGRGPALEEARQ